MHNTVRYGSIHDKGQRQLALAHLAEYLSPKQHTGMVEAFHHSKTEREVAFVMQSLEMLCGVSGYPVNAAAIEYAPSCSAFVLEGRKARQ